ncbi:hypothetical protein EXT46_05280 [Pseudoalteromonas sp. CO325X]|uniref:hypothetical protein n=1 Tax=Pseudoalteromonas sp. CO325X TaxID=1777262 RepID=UPI001022DEBB|nr:hypothetical protein [Pseudoalteromonas sp. CO325X]RZF83706.1 hypothetical protein EXT46_05280 [Pseudoalteromonas sp. CO325X]
MNDINQWLADPRHHRCILVELQYRDEGEIKTAHVANTPFRSGASDSPAHMPYDDVIAGGLEIARSMSEVFSGRSSTQLSSLELYLNDDTRRFKEVNALPVTIYMGDPTWAKSDFVTVFTGICEDVTFSSSRVSISFAEKATSLDIPVLSEHFTNGPSKGRPKPLALGECFNVTPVLIDAVNHVYQFNSTPSQAVTAVRFNGDEVSSSDYSVDLSASTITFSVQPIGSVTADVKGVVDGHYLATAADFISYLLGLRGESVLLGSLASYTLGLYITDAEMTYSQALDEVAKSIGAYWYFNRLGQFTCASFRGFSGAPVDVLRDDQNIYDSRAPRARLNAVQRLSLSYGRNYTELSNIAASVLDTNAELAQRLQLKARLATGENTNQGDRLTVDTLIAHESDANTELARRLALKTQAHYIYETEQFAAPFSWILGDEVALETPGINGNAAVITHLTESLLTSRTIVEFWQ